MEFAKKVIRSSDDRHCSESIQRFATNLLEQVKIYEEISGPLVPVRDVVKRVQRTRVVGEGDDAVTDRKSTRLNSSHLA